MAAADNLNTVRKYGASHGFTSANGRAIVDTDGTGVAPSWKWFGKMNAAAIDAWAAEQPVSTSRSTSTGTTTRSAQRPFSFHRYPAGTALAATHKGVAYSCTVVEKDGKPAYELPDGRTFPSAGSAAGALLSKSPTAQPNGWTFWHPVDPDAETVAAVVTSSKPASTKTPVVYIYECGCKGGFVALRSRSQPRCPICDERGQHGKMFTGPETIDASNERASACTCNVPPMSPGGEFDADEPCPLHPRSLDTADDVADEWPPVTVEPAEQPAKTRKPKAPRTPKRFDNVPETDEIAALQQTVAISAADQKAEQKRLKKLSAEPKLGRRGRLQHAATKVAANKAIAESRVSVENARAIIANANAITA